MQGEKYFGVPDKFHKEERAKLWQISIPHNVLSRQYNKQVMPTTALLLVVLTKPTFTSFTLHVQGEKYFGVPDKFSQDNISVP